VPEERVRNIGGGAGTDVQEVIILPIDGIEEITKEDGQWL
jgi:hypothetical protein